MEIFCGYCGFGRGDLVGSESECNYYRVVDATKKSESYDEFQARKKEARKQGLYLREEPLKKYFCTGECYLNYVFVSCCARGVKVNPDEVRADAEHLLASDPVVEKRMRDLHERYDEITSSAREMPAFKAFMQRQVDIEEERREFERRRDEEKRDFLWEQQERARKREEALSRQDALDALLLAAINDEFIGGTVD